MNFNKVPFLLLDPKINFMVANYVCMYPEPVERFIISVHHSTLFVNYSNNSNEKLSPLQLSSLLWITENAGAH